MEVALRRLLGQAPARADRQHRAPGALKLKLVYFVPEGARDSTREACFAAGGGRIGDYERCSWYTLGTGTFVAGEGADPAVGEVGEEERVPEYRVEVVVPEERLSSVLDALRAAHPYEEVAFDLYPLHELT